MFNDQDPEDIFKMVSVLPKKKMRVEAHLEDQEGEKITVAQICKELVAYITQKLQDDEDNTINTQLFPLSTDLIVSIVPRFMGNDAASIMLGATMFRQALATLSLSSFLFNQYITQHKLKIVSVSTELSDSELQLFVDNSKEADKRLLKALEGFTDDDIDEGEDEI